MEGLVSSVTVILTVTVGVGFPGSWSLRVASLSSGLTGFERLTSVTTVTLLLLIWQT